MKTFFYLIMVIYFFIVSLPVFIIIFILTHLFYTFKKIYHAYCNIHF